MSGSIGIPPGTQWLQDQKPRRSHQQGSTQRNPQQELDESGHGDLVQKVNMELPSLGRWQFRMEPDWKTADQWKLWGSSPDSEEWNHSTTRSLGEIINLMNGLRGLEWN